MITTPSAGSDVLIFLHVPKTAGTTLNRIIETQYSPMRIYSIPGGWGSSRSTRKFKRLSARRLSRLQVVKGHLEFGIHRYLLRPASYITILRDPVDRMISSYFYALGDRFHPLHAVVASKKMSLAQFLELVPWGHNLQAKLIGGIPMPDIRPPQALAAARHGEILSWEQFSGRHCDREVLEAAKYNLEHHFSLVGLTERFNESLALMKIAYGWQFSRFQTFRRSKKRPGEINLPMDVIAKIRQMNAFDLELYTFAEKLFQVKLEQNRSEVEKILAHFDSVPKPGPWSSRYRKGLVWARFAVSLMRSTL